MSSLIMQLIHFIAPLLFIVLLAFPSLNHINHVLVSAADSATESSPYDRRIEECFFKLYNEKLIDLGIRKPFETNGTETLLTTFSKSTSTLPTASNSSALSENIVDDGESPEPVLSSGLNLAPLLHDCFLCNAYNREHPPLRATAPYEPLPVVFDASFKSLINLANDGSMQVKLYMNFYWNDSYRRWNQERIPIPRMRMPAYDVWHPVFMLENCEDDAECFVRPFRNLSRVTFTPDGRGNYWLTKKLFVDCDMELNKFPYDTQQCKLIFYLNELSTEDVVLIKSGSQEEDVTFDHEEWEYLGVNLTVLNFTNTDPIETGFSVELRFRRRPMFYLYNLIVPVMLMAVIGFFALFLPNGTGDKINLEQDTLNKPIGSTIAVGDSAAGDSKLSVQVSVLLGFMFIQSIIATLLPKSNQSPLLADYLLGALTLSAVNLVVSAIIMMVFNLGESKSTTVRRIEQRLLRHNSTLLRIYSFGLYLCKLQRDPGKSLGRSPKSRPLERPKKGNVAKGELDPEEEHGEEFEMQIANARKTSSSLQIDLNDANCATSRPLIVGSDGKPGAANRARGRAGESNLSGTKNSVGLFAELEAILPAQNAQKSPGPNVDEGMISLSVSPHSASNSNNEGGNENGKRENKKDKTGEGKLENEQEGDGEEGDDKTEKLDYDPVEFWNKMADFINRIATSILILAQFLIVIFFLAPIFA